MLRLLMDGLIARHPETRHVLVREGPKVFGCRLGAITQHDHGLHVILAEIGT